MVLVLLAGCASGRATVEGRPEPRVSLVAPTEVPIQVMDQARVTLVSATINRTPSAVLMVDSGAHLTILSPLAAKRLSLTIPENAPRQKFIVVGGQMIEIPFVTLASFQVGAAVLENFPVGVYEILPQFKWLDGLLGKDFLDRFRVTVDKSAARMRLEPLSR